MTAPLTPAEVEQFAKLSAELDGGDITFYPTADDVAIVKRVLRALTAAPIDETLCEHGSKQGDVLCKFCDAALSAAPTVAPGDGQAGSQDGMPTAERTDYDAAKVLHILRNPYGWSDDAKRKARLTGADLIESLLRDLDAARQSHHEAAEMRDYLQANHIKAHAHIEKQEAEITTLRAQLASAEGDAKRYRWIRKNANLNYHDGNELAQAAWDALIGCSKPRELDAAIDAALAADKPQEGVQ